MTVSVSLAVLSISFGLQRLRLNWIQDISQNSYRSSCFLVLFPVSVTGWTFWYFGLGLILLSMGKTFGFCFGFILLTSMAVVMTSYDRTNESRKKTCFQLKRKRRNDYLAESKGTLGRIFVIAWQCDQIGRFWKVLGNKVPCKSSPHTIYQHF